MLLLNDVHSALNPTRVSEVHRPTNLAQLQHIVRNAATGRTPLSVAGGRHAMGGQQFLGGAPHIDTGQLDKVLGTDAARGLLRVEAGAMWPAIVAAAQAMRHPAGGQWAIRQKQTGVDQVSLAGSISANAHGRGLLMRPLVDDIEDVTLVDATGELVHCSRTENGTLFSLVSGGYGLFGIVYAATLRLVPRQRVVRLVDVLDLEDASAAVYRRVQQGCLYGDFQFVIDPRDPAFMQRGVFACYQPVAAHAHTSPEEEDRHADLQPGDWLQLLKLAHVDKSAAFVRYAQHYIATHGRTYWSDTMQLSTYLPTYAEALASEAPAASGGVSQTLVIGELYVPRDHIGAFMQAAARVHLRREVEVIYGTIRAILRDDTSFLPWARDDFACVVFNLRTPHTDTGRQRTADAFRDLIDEALALGGSFFLTYHRYARADQLLAAYPQLPQFLAAKERLDPQGVFASDWYRHLRSLLG